ncbi:MAG TPA: putative metal-binding motif-containing protein [Polyangiaceae bacterium]|nr:putative metal-binding motif-containing protein [Polyangiaceae bacterium]
MLLKSRSLFGSLAVLALSCGARTSIYTSDAGVDSPVVCSTDLDCDTGDACAQATCQEGTCVALPAVVCDDQDACTEDSCDAQSGKCSYTPVTLDLDGDGHRAARPGFAPGAPGSCGDDCDDRSASAHPGGTETCDGADNDCNGKIDDGAQYNFLQLPVRVGSSSFDKTNGGGMAFDGKNYGITFSGHVQRWGAYFTSLARSGSPAVPETPISDLNSETYAGLLIHNGRYFASAWPDARQAGNYEVYFNRYDSNGNKLGPDVRVSNAMDFSLDPVLAWNGTESIVVWDDRRDTRPNSEAVRLYGQRISFDGSLVGDNVALTNVDVLAESPDIALSQTRVGVVYTSRVTLSPTQTETHAKFFTTAPDLTQPTPTVELGGSDVEDTRLVYVGGHFAAFWQQQRVTYAPSIFGATVDESGKVLSAARAVTTGAAHARSFSAVSLGDRVILVWADDLDGNYELYMQIMDANLAVLSPRTRLSFTGSPSLFPIAALGPKGDLGVLYDELQSTGRQTYFLGMSCVMSGSISP